MDGARSQYGLLIERSGYCALNGGHQSLSQQQINHQFIDIVVEAQIAQSRFNWSSASAQQDRIPQIVSTVMNIESIEWSQKELVSR